MIKFRDETRNINYLSKESFKKLIEDKPGEKSRIRRGRTYQSEVEVYHKMKQINPTVMLNPWICTYKYNKWDKNDDMGIDIVDGYGKVYDVKSESFFTIFELKNGPDEPGRLFFPGSCTYIYIVPSLMCIHKEELLRQGDEYFHLYNPLIIDQANHRVGQKNGKMFHMNVKDTWRFGSEPSNIRRQSPLDKWVRV